MLLIPEDGFFESNFASIRSTLDSRIPLIGQVMDISGDISDMMRSGGQGVTPFNAVIDIDNDTPDRQSSIPTTSPYGYMFRDIYDHNHGLQLLNNAITPFNDNTITTNSTAPMFGTPMLTYTLPETLGGGSFQLLDLSHFDRYRGFIHAMIIGINLYWLIRKILRKLPKMLYK
jgi:hypothetical protein